MFSSVPEYTWGVDMDKDKFKKLFPTIDSITVIRGFFKNSDAYKKWNVNTIGNIFGDDKFKIDSYSKDVGHWSEDGIEKTMQKYVDYMKKHENPNLYLAEFEIEGDGDRQITNEDVLQNILDDVLTKNYTELNTFDKIVMYFGKNACTEPHVHFVDNYIVNQVFGSKTFYCCDYNDNNHIFNKNKLIDIITNNVKNGSGYPSSYNNADGTTTKTFMDLDFNTFNKLYKVTINPGDALLIPPWWWHTTQGHDINCTVVKGYKRANVNYLLKSFHLFISWYIYFGFVYFTDNIGIFTVIFFFILTFFNILDKYFPNKYNKYAPYFFLFLYPILPVIQNLYQKSGEYIDDLLIDDPPNSE